MDKIVKDVFKNCVREENLFNIANVKEIKFSKKLNAVILDSYSQENIPQSDIEEFERLARNQYELSSFKINYEYTGKPKDINIQNVYDILTCINKKYSYTQDLFENCKINIDNDEKILKIELEKPYSNFLYIKRLDEYMKNSIDKQFGSGYKVLFRDIDGSAKNSYTSEAKMVKLEDLAEAFKTENNDQSGATNNATTPNKEKPKFVPRAPLTEEEKKEREMAKEPQPENVYYGVNIQNPVITKIEEVVAGSDRVCINGQLINKEERELRSGKILLTIDVTDKTSTVSCKMFLDKQKYEEVDGKLKKDTYILVQGRPQIDAYSNELTIMVNNICKGEKPPERMDNSEQKRVELHLHTQMSAMDAVTSVTDLVKQAIKWGHPAIAITDHGVVQSFPEANHVIVDNYANLVQKEGKITTQDILDAAPIKIIYGVEGYLVRDVEPEIPELDTYCVFDLETTGFNPDTDGITEVAVCKVKNGEIVDEYTTFVNPEKPIPFNVQELTHITDEMVADAPKMSQMIPEFLEFCKGCILVAHNAHFDVSFIENKAKKLGLEFKPQVIDTYEMSLELYNGVENHKLGTLVEYLGIPLEGAHRAINDTRATAKMFIRMKQDCDKEKIEINNYVFTNISDRSKNLPANHIIILAKNYVGLKNLYKLVSYSHVWNFHKKPKISRSMLKRYREGLIIGSACEQGELYQEILDYKVGRNDGSQIEQIANFYDYLEIQPLGNNAFYERIGKKIKKEGKRPKDEEPEYIKLTHQQLIDINKDIVDLGDKLNKPVVATCDVHFMNPEDEIYRRIIQAGQGFDDADMQAPLYFRTTEEMLKEFDYLTPEKAYEVVVENTNLVASWCNRISPISDEKCPPHIDGCEQDIRNIAMEKAHKLYGDPLPDIVQDRLDRELNSIISNGYSVMYIIAQRLVWDSNDHGYIVGSRGSVGSSLAAYMTGITEVNSLKSHYRCPVCKYSDFSENGCANGFDLPDKKCPKCGADLDKDGMDIPFETFLGFEGDKVPDIDLNFSGDYQPKAHAYTKEVFGEDHVFRAGTVGTVQEKTAYGYIKGYEEEMGIVSGYSEAKRIDLAKCCEGVKRTTGQHPGGIVVVPLDMDVHDFTPVQYPANNPNAEWKTTHFDFHQIHDNILKFDILGHVDPTAMKMMERISGIDVKTIPMNDKETMSIFSSTDALNIDSTHYNQVTGAAGLPEFGTPFVRGILEMTKPTTFAELVTISGLSHGTDVWLGNAKDLIDNGTCKLNEVIGCRDDIMVDLIGYGLPSKMSFTIMESVRKGKGLKPEWIEEMKKHDVPDWYIDSCQKIKYMFPKAHAVAYVMMAVRIAWFKVHMPLVYYCQYFSIRCDAYDIQTMIAGEEAIRQRMSDIRRAREDKTQNVSDKENAIYDVLELALEMSLRGYRFSNVSINRSAANEFILDPEDDKAIIPPFTSLDGLGDNVGKSVVQAREQRPFLSKEDVLKRTQLSKTLLDRLDQMGALEGLDEENQMTLF